MSKPQVFQINISDGGVPKRPLRQASITAAGVIGDRQADAEHHGGPDRALCLFSLEHILDLQAEGHPLYPGSIGENITVAGLDWSRIRPGSRMRLGEEVEIEITDYASPCSTIEASFSDGQFGRVAQRRHPGWSRVLARVLNRGQIRIGDDVVLLAEPTK
jgi:MOSC domain-containing protein YiiM